ncbi:hypothetical protein J3F83DRAFT_746717 [Trichoderma novae-zelandiae]
MSSAPRTFPLLHLLQDPFILALSSDTLTVMSACGPSPKYIVQCMEIPDVKDFLKGCNYRKPVYLVTGLKVAKGVSVCLNHTQVRKASGKAVMSLNSLAGPEITHADEKSLTTEFTESSVIVVGIQCLKLYCKSSWLEGGKDVKLGDTHHTQGAVFVDDEENNEDHAVGAFVNVDADVDADW